MYDEILVPTDGSEAAAAALNHAIDLAERYGARLHALYVVDARAYATLDAGANLVIDSLEGEGDEAVRAIEERAEGAGLDVITEVATGTPHEAILEYADERDIDLIVMGTHGRRGLDRVLLGSVTERVVRSSPVPVMTIRAPDESS
jgi:nucleotide-binding universal stress UspA family protein